MKAQGEIVLLIEGRAPVVAIRPEHLADVERLQASGERLKAAATQVAAEHGLGSRALYEAVLASRRAREAGETL